MLTMLRGLSIANPRIALGQFQQIFHIPSDEVDAREQLVFHLGTARRSDRTIL